MTGALTAERLSAYMTAELDADVSVADLAPVTAGARRINVLFDATINGTVESFCVTQQPNTGEAFERSMLSEAQWLRNAAAASVRVAEIIAASEDESILGGPFFISRQINGATIPKKVIELCGAHPGLGANLAHQIGESMARMHDMPVDEVPDDVERPTGNTVEAAIEWAETELADLLQRSPALELTLRWMIRNQPTPGAAVPIHGDVRNGNIIVNESGLGAIVDWETAHIGDRFEDLAWLAQRMWRARNDQLEIGGFANRSDLRAGYEAGGGEWDDERFHWWKVFRTLWWGVGMARQGRQHIDGTFRNIIMAASGRRVAELEWDALCLIEGR
jgi:aminoglycoside phosphotransferase (APT) family kinase protein